MVLRLAFFALTFLGLLGFGAVVWLSTHVPNSSGEMQAATAQVAILTAATPVRAGSLLKPEDFSSKEVSRTDIGDGASLDTAQARYGLIGSMARRNLAIGDVLKISDVIRPGDRGFLSAVLDPGMRAVSVGVDAISGAAGLIWPGDRIDIILTQALTDPAVPVGRRIAAETVLSDVRVIAIDQQIVQAAALDNSPGKSRTVTLEVTSVQAERIVVATRIGRLSLVVRSAEHRQAIGAVTAPATMWASDVSPALATAPIQRPPNTLHVFQGIADGKEFRF